MRKVSSTFGKENIPPIDELFNELFKFLDVYINDFKDFLSEYHKVNKEAGIILKNKIEQEDDITNPLVVFLNENSSFFYFHNQFKSLESNSTTDIGIFKKFTKIPFCFVEAKRLPTPLSNGRQETEYVCYNDSTKQGGIERFKTEKHGGKEKLNQSIMLGYIQENNFSFWHSKVNSWIDEKINLTSNWQDEDKLIQNVSFVKSNVSMYTSIHSRSVLQKIKLIHYWIDLN
ncbi:hypothetical protein [Flavobacterium sp.]|uniref:hypothetical protein n=1 Tax=Flavobacterium sp. TaxID=239 RepID=UPI002639F59F|nr:hypothetical protein [Flavobacterium sp.]